MKLVIDIDEEVVEHAKEQSEDSHDEWKAMRAIANGTPLDQYKKEENFKADNMESVASNGGDPFVDGVLSGLFNIRKMVIRAPYVILQPFKAESEGT